MVKFNSHKSFKDSLSFKMLIPLVLIIFAGVLASTGLLSNYFTEEIREHAKEQVSSRIGHVQDEINTANKAYIQLVETSMKTLKSQGAGYGNPSLGKPLKLAGKTVPSLYLGKQLMVMNNTLVDKVQQLTGSTATLFVKNGEEFVRVCTNVKNENGGRAIGTLLDPSGKAIASIRKGKTFYGVVDILGSQYITGYEPMYDKNKNIIGVWYVGYPLSTMQILEEHISKHKLLENGFMAVVDSEEKVVFKPKNISEQLIIKMIGREESDLVDDPLLEKWVIYKKYFAGSDYIILAAYPLQDIEIKVARAKLLVGLLGIGTALLLALAFLFLFWISVSKPVALLTAEMEKLSEEGAAALDQRVSVSNLDEVGQLARAFNSIVDTFARQVRRLELQGEALEAAANAIVITDKDGRIHWVNQAFNHLTGYSPEEVAGKNLRFLKSGKHDGKFYRRLWKTVLSGKVWHGEVINRRKDGTLYTEEMTVTPVRAESGEITNFVAIKQDVSQRIDQEALLRQQLAAMEVSLDGIGVFNRVGKFIYANEALARMFGYDRPKELLGKSWKNLYTKEEKKRIGQEVIPDLFTNGSWQGESTGKRKDGTTFPQDLSMAAIENSGLVCIVRNITERKKAEETIRYHAFHDGLTGLPNRMLFRDRLKQALSHAGRSNSKLAVMFLDLDRFKLVNDTLGHAMGDRFLKTVSEKLAGCIRKSDTVARMGGDEFMLLLEMVKDDDALIVAEKIINTLKKPWYFEGHVFHITASIGVAIFPNDGQDAETLMKNADVAMYRAKEQGNTFQLYAPAMNERALERMHMEMSLEKALEKEEFLLYYQPQVNIGSGSIIGMEALIRWQHPERGLLSPMEFIPLAEESGLIIPIGEWVLRTACRQAADWQKAGYQPIRVAVNLSARQFQQHNLAGLIKNILEETGLSPHWLELEITESIAMSDVEFSVKILRELRDMGIRIAIDDFGTGYSSFTYLKQFPVNTLKIDRTFVRDIHCNPHDAAIAAAFIVLAQNLDLGVIAEGVETEEQSIFLRKRNCLEMQGYLFGKPVPPVEFEKMLRG